MSCKSFATPHYSTINSNMASSEEDIDAMISSYILSEFEYVEKPMTSPNEGDEYDISDALLRAMNEFNPLELYSPITKMYPPNSGSLQQNTRPSRCFVPLP